MLPIHRQIYNWDAPRFSKEDEVDILPVVRLFGEETFTYIRVFCSITPPHVLPYYVLDKLIAREIDYQIASEGGLSKALKEEKKVHLAYISFAIWSIFTTGFGACI